VQAARHGKACHAQAPWSPKPAGGAARTTRGGQAPSGPNFGSRSARRLWCPRAHGLYSPERLVRAAPLLPEFWGAEGGRNTNADGGLQNVQVSTFASLVNAQQIVNEPGSDHCRVAFGFFRDVLRARIERIFLDVDWYLNAYPDVKLAIKKGAVRSAQEHYIAFGYFENRLPYRINVNEQWYLDQNPDVRTAISNETVRSAQEHFEQVGFGEGRLPFPAFQLRTVDVSPSRS
jgi:hypothetical protein